MANKLTTENIEAAAQHLENIQTEEAGFKVKTSFQSNVGKFHNANSNQEGGFINAQSVSITNGKFTKGKSNSNSGKTQLFREINSFKNCIKKMRKNFSH